MGLSLAILVFAFSVTLSAIFNDQTTMYEGVSPPVTVVLFFVFMSIVGMLEGMQIAFFAVAKMTVEERSKSAWAKKTCDVLFANDGRNLPGFMVRRQMCVTLRFFIIARVTTIRLNEGDENIFGYSDGVQAFFETGLLGALITTIVASIVWQMVASAFPMAYLSSPITYLLMRFCLALEWTGLMQGAWVMARCQRRVTTMKRDEVYIGTAEERAAKAAADPEHFHADEKPEEVYGAMGTGPTAAAARPNVRSVEAINSLERELYAAKREIQQEMYDLQQEKKKMKEHVSNW